MSGATTVTGTDTTVNWFSINNGEYAIGLGGPNPASYVGDLPTHFTPEDPQDYDAILKINSSHLLIQCAWIAQGFEDSLNIADGSENVSIFDADFGYAGPPGLRSITVKGGCKDIALGGVIHQRGTSWWQKTVSIDDWLDQNLSASDGIDLSWLQMADGTDVQVVIRLGCTKNVNLGHCCKIAFFQSAARTVYYFFKRGVRALLRIPVGKSGPSWLP